MLGQGSLSSHTAAPAPRWMCALLRATLRARVLLAVLGAHQVGVEVSEPPTSGPKQNSGHSSFRPRGLPVYQQLRESPRLPPLHFRECASAVHVSGLLVTNGHGSADVLWTRWTHPAAPLVSEHLACLEQPCKRKPPHGAPT